MSLNATIFNTFFKRNAAFVGTIFFGAFVFQGAFDSAVTKFYLNHNKGKLWADVKGRLNAVDEDEDDDDY